MTARTRLEVSDGAEALAEAAAERFVHLAGEAQRRDGHFAVALTGGSSPTLLYRRLGDEAYAARVAWDRVHLFWGDERAVPPGHPRSNFGMARGRLVERVPIPAANVHRIRGELGAKRAAASYEAEVREVLGDRPRFHLIHLGLGTDGHILSLFPFDLERLRERERLVLPALYRERGEGRITLTPPVLAAAGEVAFLVPGAEKVRVARTAIHGPLDPMRVPAQLAYASRDEVVWHVSEAVAGGLRP